MQIIIVDDEAVTRKWVRQKIEELHVNYHVTGEFANGKQALSYLMAHHADVIVTDIRMPVMDGLELLEELKKKEIKAYKIILSAYDEFHYARQAMKLGAQEFLLKPEITKDELGIVLKGAEDYVIKLREARKEKEQEEENIQIRCLKEILWGVKAFQEEEIRSMLAEADVCLKPKRLICFVISFEEDPLERQFAEVAELFLKEAHTTGYCFPLPGNQLVMVYNQESVWGRLSFADKLFQLFKAHAMGGVYIGVSLPGDGVCRLKDLLRQGEAAMENRRFFGIPGSLRYEELSVGEWDGEKELGANGLGANGLGANGLGADELGSDASDGKKAWCCDEEVKDVLTCLFAGNTMETQYSIRLFFLKVKRNPFLHPAYVKALCIEILSGYIQKVRETGLKEGEERDIRRAEAFFGQDFQTLQTLEEGVLAQTDRLGRLLDKKRRKSGYSQAVRMIAAYLETRYKEKISLDEMARLVHLNKSYVSVLFKKETGERFSDYLLRIRLEAATRLLNDTRLSIQAAAERAGFQDSAYFSRAFKDNYGMTPMEYRKRAKNYP